MTSNETHEDQPKQSRQRRTISAAAQTPTAESETALTSPPPVTVQQPSVPVEEIEHETPPVQLGGESPLKLHDVVQIIDPQSRIYGAYFTVGDVRNGRVHGYYISEGRAKSFVTIPVNMVHRVGGQAKVRSSNPCSPKWLSDHA